MRPRKRKDSGFVLLLVLLMAAVIAINLYMELPRVAVEAQRQKEQLLILRGEQYKRAILVFYKTNGSWPTKIDDLETFNNRRFLRRRYKDPMSGTDDWRLIHYNNGVFTDSVDNKAKPGTGSQQQTASTAGSYVGINPAFNGEAGAPGSTGAAMGPNLGRRRSSDGGTGGGTLMNGASDPTSVNNGNGTTPPADGSTPPGSTGTSANGTVPGQGGVPPSGFPPGFPIPPGTTNPDGSTTGTTTANGGVPGQPGMPGMPVVPGMPFQPGMPGQPGSGGVPPGFPGVPGMPVNSQTGGVSPYSTVPGANGTSPPFGQPGTTAPGSMSPAQSMIQNILGSPRPGGMPTTSSSSGSPLTIGGGIAGVASKVDEEGIMVYNNHTNYKEWEFIFDPTKWKPPANPLAGAGTQGTPASQIGSMPTGPVGTSVTDIVNQQNGNSNNLNTTTSGSAGAGTTAPVIKQQ